MAEPVRRSSLSLSLAHLRVAALGVLLASVSVFTGCPEQEATPSCDVNDDCEAGICVDLVCLDPAADFDGDLLANGREVTLGTDPQDPDTDGDGTPDGEEIEDVDNPRDSDGDGIIDALEHAAESNDGDCIPDQQDPKDEDETAAWVEATCPKLGICSQQLGALKAVCTPASESPNGQIQWTCLFDDVDGYAEQDDSCDGLDNNCDGEADEDYVASDTSCGVGACAAAGTLTCVEGAEQDSCVAGVAAGDDATCDGVDDDCSGAADEDYVASDTSCGVGACAAAGTLTCVEGAEQDSCVAGVAGGDDATCDGVDDDCSGAADEDYVATDTSCGVGACAAAGTLSCVGGGEVDSCVEGTPADSDATCDGVDDDCDGTADQDYVPTADVVPLPDEVRAGTLLGCQAVLSGGAEDPCLPELLETAVSWTVDGADAGEAAVLDTTGFSEGTTIVCTITLVDDVGVGLGVAATSNTATIGSDRWTLLGGEEMGFAGTAVRVIGDLNGDGRAELAIGAPNEAPGGLTSAGRVYIVDGVTAGGTTLLSDVDAGEGGLALHGMSGGWVPLETICYSGDAFIIISSNPGLGGLDDASGPNGPLGDALGARIAERADVDGDGVPDLVVSAPSANGHGQYHAGLVYVIPGVNLAGASGGDIAAYALDGGAQVAGAQGTWPNKMYTLTGSNYQWNGHLLGFGLTTGDMDGDGRSDVLAGAPRADGVGQEAGRTYFLPGATLSGSLWLGDADAEFMGFQMTGTDIGRWVDSATGGHLDMIGDFDGDGLDDALVSHEEWKSFVYLLLGTDEGRDDGVLEEEADSSVGGETWEVNGNNWWLTLTTGRMMMPSRPEGIGDVNGDGLDDFVVSWFEWEDGTKQVEIGVYFGHADVASTLDELGPDQGIGGFTIEGQPVDGIINGGIHLGELGDLDGDGLDDFAFNIPRQGAGPVRDRIYVVWGSAAPAHLTLDDLAAGTGGFMIEESEEIRQVTGGDVDGDGLSDMAWGAFVADDLALDAGRVEVWFGNDVRNQLTHVGTTVDDVLAGSAAPDLMVGGLGDDVLEGLGGVDALSGGAGDDVLAVSDLTFRRLDGGEGVDVLRLVGSLTIDLAQTRGRLRNLEALDMSDGDHGLVALPRDVANLSLTSNALWVFGDAADNVELQGSGWVLDDTVTVGGGTFRAVRNGEVVVMIADPISSKIAPTLDVVEVSVAEMAAPNTLVAVVTGTDPDGAAPTMAVDVSGHPALTFDPATGELRVVDGTQLDHETEPEFALPLVATDADGLSTSGTLTVNVTNVPEAPYFIAAISVATIAEQSPAGTLVTSTPAFDDDEDDVLQYVISSGNPDGAFGIDETGKITVVDGTKLDFETDPSLILTVSVTDSTGLAASTGVSVQLTDLENFLATYTLPFLTQDQTILDEDPVVSYLATAPQLDTLDLTASADEGDAQVVTPLSDDALELEFTQSGTIDSVFQATLDEGFISALLPVDVDVETPDSISVTEPFDLPMSWTLRSEAVLWGETPSATLDLTFDFLDIVGKVAGTAGDVLSIPKWSEEGLNLNIKAKKVPFIGKLLSDSFDESITLDKTYGGALQDIDYKAALARVFPALDEVDPADHPNVVIVEDVVPQKVIELPLTTSALLEELGLPYLSYWFGFFDIPLAPYGFLQVEYAIWSALYDIRGWSAWLPMIRVEDVLVTVTFENGTQLTGSAATGLTDIDLPDDEDANGDGVIEMAIDFEIQAELTRWLGWLASAYSESDMLMATVKSFAYDFDEFGLPTNEFTLENKYGWGPFKSSKGASDLGYTTDTMSKWTLTGFEPIPTITGALQTSDP